MLVIMEDANNTKYINIPPVPLSFSKIITVNSIFPDKLDLTIFIYC